MVVRGWGPRMSQSAKWGRNVWKPGAAGRLAVMTMRDVVRAVLAWLGVRSTCCAARIYRPTGWGWRRYCTVCHGRLT